eukprot:693379_1
MDFIWLNGRVKLHRIRYKLHIARRWKKNLNQSSSETQYRCKYDQTRGDVVETVDGHEHCDILFCFNKSYTKYIASSHNLGRTSCVYSCNMFNNFQLVSNETESMPVISYCKITNV